MSFRLGKYSYGSVKAVDIAELVRFLIAGGGATVGNLATVWVVRHFASFEWSLVAGIAAGSTLSFVMSKLFAFRSRKWNNAPGELGRFALVYGAGLILYWLVSITARQLLVAAHVQPQVADMSAVLSGAAVMTVSSYFGHRFFTYRPTARLA
jgi:putative flippase GtrA